MGLGQLVAGGPLIACRLQRPGPFELEPCDLVTTVSGCRELIHAHALASEQVLEQVTRLLVVLDEDLARLLLGPQLF